MLKISFVILLICCLTVTQIKAQKRPKCSNIEEKLEGCNCVRESILNSGAKLEWCPGRYTMRDDGECVRIFNSQAICEDSKSPSYGDDGCVCL